MQVEEKFGYVLGMQQVQRSGVQLPADVTRVMQCYPTVKIAYPLIEDNKYYAVLASGNQ